MRKNSSSDAKYFRTSNFKNTEYPYKFYVCSDGDKYR